MRTGSGRYGLAGMVLALACAGTSGGAGGGGGESGGNAAGESAGGSAADPPGAGGAVTGGSDGTPTGGTGGTAGGVAGGTGGSVNAGTGGTAGVAAAGGAPGGAGGAGGVGANPAAILDLLRWEVNCGRYVENNEVCENFPVKQTSCPGGGNYNLNRTVTFGGAAGTFYDVTLRFRGVVEPKPYVGGTSDGKHFYTGGTPGGDVYNVYSLTVTSPRQVYYFNHDEGRGVGHYVFTIDHMKTIRIEGGTGIRLVALDANCSSIRNCATGTIGPNCKPYVIAGVPPDTGFDGQFIQMDVVSVVVAN